MNKGRRFNKECKNQNKGKIIAFIMLVVFICLLIFSSIKIINYIKDNRKNEEIIDEISKSITINDKIENNYQNESKYNIDFKTLKKTNPDMVGFLKVNGTDIETIVVQGKDNSFYLSHNFEKKYNSAGWIYADYRNNLDGTDMVIICEIIQCLEH